MALAYGTYQELTNQLRFLLFEIGIGLSQQSVEFFITQAHRDCLNRLIKANKQENIVTKPLLSHQVHDYLDQFKQAWIEQEPGARFYPWQQLEQELNESIANQSLALAYRHQWQTSLKRQCSDHQNLWAWAVSTLLPHQQLSFFEQWGSIGHQYHPNFKAKIGLSRREVMQYSPEFQARVNVQWCALHKSKASTSHLDVDYKKLIKENFPQQMHCWQQKLALLNKNPDDYVPIPVHPWQFRNKIQNYFASLIDQGLFIPLLCHQSTKPSMSFRTMITDRGVHLKLATGVHTTSAMRTVSPASVHNGVALSQCLDKILKLHGHFEDSFYIVNDLGGVHVSNPFNHDSKHLAAIIRQDPCDYVEQGETIIPLASLFNRSPVTNKPLLVEIIETARIAPEDYFVDFISLLFKGHLPLYLKYGIALEAHQQNSLLVFKNHRPIKCLNRDLGGIRLYRNNLMKAGFDVNLQPNSIIESDGISAVRDKFIHANLQSNVAHWIEVLQDYFGLNQQKLWQKVREELMKQCTAIQSQIEPAFFKQEVEALFNKPWQQKCLLRMRLQPNKDYLLQPVKNPLLIRKQ